MADDGYESFCHLLPCEYCHYGIDATATAGLGVLGATVGLSHGHLHSHHTTSILREVTLVRIPLSINAHVVYQYQVLKLRHVSSCITYNERGDQKH